MCLAQPGAMAQGCYLQFTTAAQINVLFQDGTDYESEREIKIILSNGFT